MTIEREAFMETFELMRQLLIEAGLSFPDAEECYKMGLMTLFIDRHKADCKLAAVAALEAGENMALRLLVWEIPEQLPDHPPEEPEQIH